MGVTTVGDHPQTTGPSPVVCSPRFEEPLHPAVRTATNDNDYSTHRWTRERQYPAPATASAQVL